MTDTSQDPSASTPTPTFRVIKISTCPSLTGKSTLGYHIGCNDQSEIFFRMSSNSGGGYFSPEWVSLKAIQDALDKAPKPLTSFALSMLFLGKSVNTPSFLFGSLLAEGLVQRDEENPRVYVSCPIEGFLAQVGQLIDAGANLKVPAKVAGKGVVKNRPKKEIEIPVLKSSPRGRPKKSKSKADATSA